MGGVKGRRGTESVWMVDEVDRHRDPFMSSRHAPQHPVKRN
jgi:hypothetical protein